jgi:hypothetical protein
MASLKDQLPDLYTLAIHLIVNAARESDFPAKTGWWSGRQLRNGPMDDSGPFSNSPPDPELSLYNTFTELLKAAQKEGPGKEKSFRLSVERKEATYEAEYFAKYGRYEESTSDPIFDPAIWKPWSQHSEEVDFVSVDDLGGFIAKTWEECSGYHGLGSPAWLEYTIQRAAWQK